MNRHDDMSTMDLTMADGVRLHVETYGSPELPPLLLLHGFPDSIRLWRNMVPVFVSAGYFVVAFDQRGFGHSDKPEDVSSYLVPRLVRDVAAVMDSLNLSDAHLVGHDWGANVAWSFASVMPERVRTLSALASGHPGYRRSIRSLEKAWYVFAFQFDVAEELFASNDWALFRSWAQNHSELNSWIDDLSRPGALRAGMNWYRANYPPEGLFQFPMEVGTISVPVLGVFGTGDPYLEEERMRLSSDFVTGRWQYVRIDAGHWLPLDAPIQVTELILRFIGDVSEDAA